MSNDRTNYGEIEIGFHRVRPEAYEVELRVHDPDPKNQVLLAPARGQARIILEDLADLQMRPADYGVMLSRSVFADKTLLQHYSNARAVFDDRKSGLRFRVLISESAPELHDLRWELLVDPRDHSPLGTSERILFSRFPASRDWRSIDLRPKSKLKALIAVAAPSDLGIFGLAAVDAPGEILRAKTALAKIEVKVSEGPLTLQKLITDLREGVDILYLVCHGAMPEGAEPILFLEDETGKTKTVTAAALTRRLSDLAQVPRLVVLVSCESAGPGADGTSQAQSSLAPRLAEAGVPAILAMHGRISMKTVELAMPVFLRELLEDGQIDRALAVARGAVRDRADHWMPALFLRLKAGKIWYEPGFMGTSSELKTWTGICENVQSGQFIPVLGPGLGSALFGGYRKVATQLAEQHHFPGAIHESSDLPKVVQYLTTQQKRDFAESEVERQVVDNIVGAQQGRPLNQILNEKASAILTDPDDPYRILADLPAKIYICASPETTMLRTLKAKGKTPEPLACSWRTSANSHPVQPKPQKVLEPDEQNPWVYHVFGAFGVKDSLVITEDDFFDYLIATSRFDLIPAKVSGSLVKSSLLLLGFKLDDWTFRILFRMIMALDGAANMQGFSHVGVQVDPDDHSLADVNRARDYLSDYFRLNRVVGRAEPSIDVYWGSSTDFLKDLRDRLAEAEPLDISATAAGDQCGWD